MKHVCTTLILLCLIANIALAHSKYTTGPEVLPTAMLALVTDEACEDETIFLSGATPAGGILSGAGVTGSSFDASVAGVGTHTITNTFTDGNGCTNIATDDIEVYELPTVSLNLGTTTACDNDMTLALTGGLPAGGTYSGTGVTGANFDVSVAGAGTHTITYTFTDGNDCTNTAQADIVVTSIPTVSLALGTTTSCDDNSTVVLSGGLPAGGTYSGTGVSGTNFDASVAGVGTHAITYIYTDGNGCTNTAQADIVVTAIPTITLAVTGVATPLLCNASNGAASGIIDITVSGGTAPYSYNWIGPNGFNATTEDLSNLPAGTYALTVRDAMGASAMESWTMDEPTTIDMLAELNHADCHSNNGPLSGSIDVIVAGGLPPYTYEWTGPGVQPFSASQFGLGSGTFTLVVTDANGCSMSDTYVLTEPTPILVDVLSQQDVSCGALGNVAVSVSGGWAPYTYEWSNGEIGPRTDNLLAGLYSVTITDSNGCSSENSYTINETGFNLDHEILSEDCTNIKIKLNLSGGVAPYVCTYTTSTGGALGKRIRHY